jgi:hypothetical protein
MSDAAVPGRDPVNESTRYRRAERITHAMMPRLEMADTVPEPPRGPRLKAGVLTWEEPREKSNVTHYNIYAPDDSTLERRVPAPQTKATEVSASQALVSSYNETTKLESQKVLAGATEVSVWSNLGLMNGWAVYGDPTYGAARYRRDGGLISVEIGIANGVFAPNTLIATLPVGFRPQVGHIFTIFTSPSSLGWLNILANGVIEVRSFPGNVWAIGSYSFIGT